MTKRPPPEPSDALQHALLSRLKLRHLVLLQAVDRHRTLGRVAIETRVSQPAITKALREVEEIFGGPLFTRTTRGLVPTPAGGMVLQYASRWLAEVDAAARTLTALEAGRAGRIRFGFTQQVPQQLLSAALGHFMQGPQRVAVMTREGTTDELVSGLLARELDCAIGRSYDGEPSELVQQPIYQQQPCLVVGAKNLKRLSRGPLDWARLAELDWILPPPNTPMRRTYNAIFVGAGVRPPLPVLETASIRSLETALRLEPNGISILPRDVVAELEQAGHWAALPYSLSWNLPPVSFLTTRALETHPMVAGVRQVVIRVAQTITSRRRGTAA